MKELKELILIALLLVGCGQKLGAAAFNVPPSIQDGNSSITAPFEGFSSRRLQQVYGHEAFPTVDPGSAFLIRMIAFSADEHATPASGITTLSKLEVHLSTTSRNPDGLSTVFSENIGPNEVITFGPAPLSLRWEQSQFFTEIVFEHSFLYNPAEGNLLLDIRSNNPGPFGALDAFDLPGDSVSVLIGLSDNATTGFTLGRGLATLFAADIVPVPEPNTWALLLLGLMALGWKLRRVCKSSSSFGG